MVLVWYARPLFAAAGTGRIPVFLAIVAVLAGPLFVFLAIRAGRALPKSRVLAIAALQAVVAAGCALALYVQRPVYLVFTVDRFDLVLARDIAPQDLAKVTNPVFSRRPLGAPEYAAALAPSDPGEARRVLDAALEGGKDLQAYPQYYVAYASHALNALRRSKPVGAILERDAGKVARYLESVGRAQDSVRYLPLRARSRDGVVLLDASTGIPLEVLLVDPW